VMESIHIPMQSGSTEVLCRMRRGYTAEEYYALTDKLQARIPGVSITGDYIVGFPGETHEQFMESVYSLSRSGQYMANTAAYSARLQTPAAIWETRYTDQAVSDEDKQARLQLLNDAVTKQATAMNAQLLGQTVEIMIEGPSRRNPNRLTGRTRQNRVVNVDLSPKVPTPSVGDIVPVRITETHAFSVLGVYGYASS
jgi:tRNA-2-methylthio-N6-dimethylallyladenosine synthase